MTDPTSEGMRLIKQWLGAQSLVDRAESELSKRRMDCTEAALLLAGWMLPDDAKPGEKIAIWFHDSLIQVEKGGDGTPDKITVRFRGRKFGEMAA